MTVETFSMMEIRGDTISEGEEISHRTLNSALMEGRCQKWIQLKSFKCSLIVKEANSLRNSRDSISLMGREVGSEAEDSQDLKAQKDSKASAIHDFSTKYDLFMCLLVNQNYEEAGSERISALPFISY
jgi:hypothetical protein